MRSRKRTRQEGRIGTAADSTYVNDLNRHLPLIPGDPLTWNGFVESMALAGTARSDILKATGLDITRLNAQAIPNRRELPDSTYKFLLHNDRQQPVAVVKIASEIDPSAVRVTTELGEDIAGLLDFHTAQHILHPIAESVVRGQSMAVYRYLQPLSKSRTGWIIQRARLTPRIMGWLKAVTEQTVETLDSDAINHLYIEPLESIVKDDSEIGPEFQQVARNTLARLERGEFKPRSVVSHGDCWKNNILIDDHNYTGFESGSAVDRFMFIDWGTARIDGFPFFDLVRLSNTLKLSENAMGRLIRDHCDITGLSPADVPGCIAAAVGYLRMHPHNCPRHVLALSAQIFQADLNRFGLLR